MKIFQLIKLRHQYDFGHYWYVQILNIKEWSLLQASVGWNDFTSWPYLSIRSGIGSTISIVFWAYKFGFDIGLIERTWNWDRMDNLTEFNDEGN